MYFRILEKKHENNFSYSLKIVLEMDIRHHDQSKLISEMMTATTCTPTVTDVSTHNCQQQTSYVCAGVSAAGCLEGI